MTKCNSKNKGIAYIFDMEVQCDSRAQKEITTLLEAGYDVKACDWDKSKNGRLQFEECKIREYYITLNHIQIKVKKKSRI